MPITYEQLLKSDASNPEAVKALSVLTGVPEATLKGNYTSGGSIFADNLQNFARQTSEAVSGASGGSGEFSKLGEYAKWGGTPDPNAIQSLKNWQNKFATAGVDFASSPYQTFSNILKLPGTLTPEQKGSRETSQNYGNFLQAVTGQEVPKPYQSSAQPKTPTFIPGLSAAQQKSITDLMANRPSSQWSATDVKNWNYATGGQALPSGYPEAPASNKMTMDSFNKVSGINLPKISIPGLSTANGMVQGANTELQNIVNSLNTPQTPAEQKQQSLLDQMSKLVGDESNKAADQLTLEQSAGIPQLKQQFADINAKILSKMAEYKALTADQEGKPVTMNSIIGSQAQIQRVAASDIGLLQAQAQGLQGQLTTAQETVNRAIDLKYSTIESKLNIYQAQLNALQPTLNKEEKIQAQAQQILLNNQQQVLNEQKQAEKDKTNFVLDLVSKYPDAGINLNDSPEVAQSKIKNSRIYQQATRLVGGGNNNIPSKITPINNTITPNDGAEESVKISKLSPRAQAVYNNPSLMSNYTATEKGKITDEIINAGLDLQTAGKTTETEKLTAGYVGRMNAANNIITNFESSNPKAGASGFFQSLLPDWTASNLLKTGDFQSMQQAERDFINAVLRKESGAAIAPSEFANAEKQYFPQPGDSAQVIAQKKANRLKTIEGMTNAAGTAIKSNTKSNSNEDPLGLR